MTNFAVSTTRRSRRPSQHLRQGHLGVGQVGRRVLPGDLRPRGRQHLAQHEHASGDRHGGDQSALVAPSPFLPISSSSSSAWTAPVRPSAGRHGTTTIRLRYDCRDWASSSHGLPVSGLPRRRLTVAAVAGAFVSGAFVSVAFLGGAFVSGGPLAGHPAARPPGRMPASIAAASSAGCLVATSQYGTPCGRVGEADVDGPLQVGPQQQVGRRVALRPAQRAACRSSSADHLAGARSARACPCPPAARCPVTSIVAELQCTRKAATIGEERADDQRGDDAVDEEVRFGAERHDHGDGEQPVAHRHEQPLAVLKPPASPTALRAPSGHAPLRLPAPGSPPPGHRRGRGEHTHSTVVG